MSTRVVEITLKALHVVKNGEVTRRDARNLVSASLIYPAPGRPLLSTVKALKLRENDTVDLENGTNPVTKQPYTYADRILFKEEIAGDALLVVQVTNVEEPDKFTKFMSAFFTTAFKAGWALVSGGASNLVLAALAETVGTLHLESLKVGEDKLHVLGEVSLTIDPAGQLPSGRQALIVPEAVKRQKLVFKEGTNEVLRKEELVLKAGDQNGYVTLGVRAL